MNIRMTAASAAMTLASALTLTLTAAVTGSSSASGARAASAAAAASAARSAPPMSREEVYALIDTVVQKAGLDPSKGSRTTERPGSVHPDMVDWVTVREGAAARAEVAAMHAELERLGWTQTRGGKGAGDGKARGGKAGSEGAGDFRRYRKSGWTLMVNSAGREDVERDARGAQDARDGQDAQDAGRETEAYPLTGSDRIVSLVATRGARTQ